MAYKLMEGLTHCIPERVHNWNRESALKQAIAVMIKIRFALTGF